MGRTFRIVPNSSSFCLTEADLSLLSYHVSAHTTLNMLAGAQRYICAFFGRLLKSSLFGCSDRHENEPHSFNTPFLFVFSFFSGLASPSSGIAAFFRKFLFDSWFFSALPGRYLMQGFSRKLQRVSCCSASWSLSWPQS